MLSQKLRRAFIKYFVAKGHTHVPSSPVIPHDDPSLLFTNAGMNQFKDVFLGKSKRDYSRAVSSQKCIRVGGKHNDLDNVGHTARHLTFFEMLGNFSFGDYFKKEAIQFAWEVTTDIFVLDPEKVWVSVYEDDDESFALWEKYLPSKRIIRMGEASNFWTMGDTGPCGPSSELYFDRGSKYGSASSLADDPDGGRYLEFWNLVFMQFDRDAKGQQKSLPKQSIDAGAGLERILSLKLGADSVFQTDVLRSLISEVETLSRKHYDPENAELAPAFHVIADHIRALSFAIADGVQPSNTDRGYVLRKILRRAVRYGRTLGLQKPFLADLVPKLITCMGEDFPEIVSSKSLICEVLNQEEEGFIRTLTRGGNMLNQVIASSRTKGSKISGDAVFQLKDTYGFPIEEIQLIAKDEHLTIDLVRYSELEKLAKETSKKAHKKVTQTFDPNFFAAFAKDHPPCEFVGYEQIKETATILGILAEDSFVDELKEGIEGIILLNRTPFYAEMGGQVGDQGILEKDGNTFIVQDTKTPFPGVVAHIGYMKKGLLKKGVSVLAQIDEKRRQGIQNNHTATHLLHLALAQQLGAHVKQAGSLVEEKRLRFDFNHHKSLSPKELRSIEELVNAMVRTDQEVATYELEYQEVQKHGEIKQFFGEKYGAKVRVVDIDFSKELCGGTHTKRVGTIGYFKILKESSIAAGVRRIEAVTGLDAERCSQHLEDLLSDLASELKTPVSSVPEKIKALLEENKQLTQEMKQQRKNYLKSLLETCLSTKELMEEQSFLIAQEIRLKNEEITPFAEELLKELKSGVIALGVKQGEKCQLLIAVSPDLVQKNIHAQILVKQVAPLIEGGGGGKSNLAQAGGKDPKGLAKALEKVRTLITEKK